MAAIGVKDPETGIVSGGYDERDTAYGGVG